MPLPGVMPSLQPLASCSSVLTSERKRYVFSCLYLIQVPLIRDPGCCYRSLDASSMCCARIAANLGCRVMVLGLYTQWARRRLHPSMVDSPGCVAAGLHELHLCLSHALRITWYVWSTVLLD